MLQRMVKTSRLEVHIREAGAGVPVILVHGNCSTGAFYEETLQALPAGFWGIAPDLRGYGKTEARPIDATRGCGEWADDLWALCQSLGIQKAHLTGWSMGAGVIQRFALDHPDAVLSMTFISPLSPYGFGGTKDTVGTPCAPDFAGSGGGTVNPDFVARIQANDRSAESPNSPRNVMNAFYFKPPFKGTPAQEDRWTDSVIDTRTGEGFYPGDMVPSATWPNVAPGVKGIANAMAPKYHNTSAIKDLAVKPPVLWVRGDSDQIVSDTSLFDLAFLGQIGAVPGWPGAEACPPQPMVSQTRAVLEAYQNGGGAVTELVVPNAGHSPHVENPDMFHKAFFALLQSVKA